MLLGFDKLPVLILQRSQRLNDQCRPKGVPNGSSNCQALFQYGLGLLNIRPKRDDIVKG